MVQVLQVQSRARTGCKKHGLVNERGKPPTRQDENAPRKRVVEEGGRRVDSGLGGDVLSELRLEVCERHDAKIPVTPGAHRNGPACLFLVANDEDERNLLQ